MEARYWYGTELRRLREKAGLRLKDSGGAISPPMGIANMSEIESGMRPPLDAARTKQLEKFLSMAIFKKTGEREKPQLGRLSICFKLATEFKELTDKTIERLAKEIYKEIYGEKDG
jgi:hypothetical protein